MKVKIIQNEAEFDAAVARIGELIEKNRTPAQDEEFKLLTLVIEDYEKRHHPVERPDPLGVIEFHIERLGLGAKDVAKLFGGPKRANEILSGKKGLTLALIQKLADALDVPPGDLIRAPKTPADKKRYLGQRVQTAAA